MRVLVYAIFFLKTFFNLFYLFFLIKNFVLCNTHVAARAKQFHGNPHK